MTRGRIVVTVALVGVGFPLLFACASEHRVASAVSDASSLPESSTSDAGSSSVFGSDANAQPDSSDGGSADARARIDANVPPVAPDGSSLSDGGDGSRSDAPAPLGVPAFDHVFVIVMENESQTDIQSSSEAPYIQQLLSSYAYTNQYSTTYHPSLPNYLDLTSGSPQGVSCDCQPIGSACDSTCALFTGVCGCPITATHLGDQLDQAKIPWRNYAESMGTPCNGSASAPYAPKHVPFLYYDDVYTSASRCQERLRDYADFAPDLASGTYRYALIAPNLCNDMHGDPSCPSNPSDIARGDMWLSQEVPKLLGTPGFAPGGKDVLFIAWDEQTGSTGGTSTPMLLIVISPLARPGATNTAYHHESLLATIEDSFGVARLGGAASAMPITDMWR